MTRAVGALIKKLHARGQLPTVPYFPFLIYSTCHVMVMVCMVYYLALLPPVYYRSIIEWGQTYTEENINLYFRELGLEFVPCSVLMHKGSCAPSAFLSLFLHWLLYAKLYLVVYSIPLLLFRPKWVLSNPLTPVLIVAEKVGRSSLFFAIDATLFKYTMCVLRNLDHHPPPIAHYILALSSVIGSLGLFVE